MGGNSSREMLSLQAVNTPLIGVCFTSILFNSVQGGCLRSSNVYSNFILIYMLGLSTGFSTVLHQPLWGAKLGALASLVFTMGPKLRLTYTQRLFPSRIHYGIGCAYTSYHLLACYSEMTLFEDAGEDQLDE
ncbi:hypothetical protein ERJ75_001830700 [Trypanosoma vivax]|uniref:Uncharacterized protein n=1 Tax=Trypanosoma vivax (strain Y486) TaxID=1055687 RepID=G0U948_TRYVY|nr:hypothetical protein TRVL_05498 [Trypanosoma vivax]KAH8603494.1 hypothetical protein ERJ75_001830700 [Trypanosoma vivax]CCC54132.1 conserved hypothetical protein [Trypanosoma vivax Y486]